MKVLNEGLKKLGVLPLDERQLDMFKKYTQILLHYNQFMNLTRITDIDEIIVEHFLDSLSIVGMPILESAQEIMDIGTGAGFPGIPIKIYYPNKHMTLLDSQKKKVEFLDEVIDALNLKGIEAIHGRAEDIARDIKYREKYDVVVSRAVAPLPVLLEYAIPFLKVGGCFISYKGPNVYREVDKAQRAMEVLGAELIDVEEKEILNSDKTHMILKIEKTTKTDSRYPRRAGKPKKSPL
ncbi:MAG TPA: 16S rRNA (guanine(527)-N(7))-methyltransferase RsmG [Clostridiales bacterium]|nr:16S rRNA (guanine(527)-N(7))-methyltransferase RsmG [Clostridiales bacterium]